MVDFIKGKQILDITFHRNSNFSRLVEVEGLAEIGVKRSLVDLDVSVFIPKRLR